MMMDKECGDVIQSMKESIASMQKELHGQNKVSGEILHCLKGNDIDEDGGLVQKINNLKVDLSLIIKRVEVLERWKIQVVAYSFAAGAVGAIAFKLIDLIFKITK
jgi:hypothetical protein